MAGTKVIQIDRYKYFKNRFLIEELGEEVEALDFEEFSYTLYVLTKTKKLFAIKF